MKLKFVALLLIGFQFPAGAAWADAKQVEVAVKGMVCSFCAQGIKKKFSAEDAVSEVNVSLEKHRVDLALKEGRSLSDEKITEVLKDAGYTVEKIERQ